MDGHRRRVQGYDCGVYKIKLTQSGLCGKELLQKIQTYTGGALNGPYEPMIVKRTKPQKQWILTWMGKDLVKRFRYMGFTPRKSLTAVVPDVPRHLRSHFFRGVFDGDGSFTETIRTGTLVMTITGGSRKVMETLAQWIKEETGQKSCIMETRRICPKSKKLGTYWVFHLSENPTRIVAEWMYRSKEDSVWLARKFDRFMQQHQLLKSA